LQNVAFSLSKAKENPLVGCVTSMFLPVIFSGLNDSNVLFKSFFNSLTASPAALLSAACPLCVSVASIIISLLLIISRILSNSSPTTLLSAACPL